MHFYNLIITSLSPSFDALLSLINLKIAFMLKARLPSFTKSDSLINTSVLPCNMPMRSPITRKPAMASTRYQAP
jgi:hypothetical protein